MYASLLQHRLIPVVEIDHVDNALPLAEALLDGGISIIEITLRTDAAAASIEAIAKRYPQMLVGAGTVLTLEDSQMVRDRGAAFGVAPGLNPDVVASFHADGLPFLPGVITPTEVERALALDCRLLKFFPAEAAGGLAYLRALSGPYASRDIKFCATGGISEDKLADYLACPLVAAVGGSWIAAREQIAAANWSAISDACRAAMARVAAA